MSYNSHMKAKTAAPTKKAPRKEKLKTRLVSVRISEAHIDELDELEKVDGVQRSAQIQRAVGEYLERRRK